MAQILAVAMKAEHSAAMSLLRGSAYDVAFVVGFEAAVKRLDRTSPDVLISEVRLGQFNGLHLVIRSQTAHPNLRSILTDRVHDPVIEFDAKRHGAIYLAEPITPVQLLETVTRQLADGNPQRRWPRKQPIAGLVAQIARRSARVVDLSYGGVRLELPPSDTIPARFQMAIPGFPLVVRARPVWTRYTAVGSISCGAELSEANPKTLAMWRDLVDSIQGAA
jgi:FixJ family two-component response regulator